MSDTLLQKPKLEPLQNALVNSPGVELRWVLLSDAIDHLWARNAKKHDLGSLIQSFKRHGFRDPSAYDATLGAVVAGNGRLEALSEMRRSGEPPPRGVAVLGDGEWAVPIYFGLDAESVAAAEAYGLDHNNLGLLGGDFGLDSILRMYDEDQLKTILADAAMAGSPPVSLDEADIDALLQGWDGPGGGADKDADRRENSKLANSLAERFIVPPFSVLDTRQGYWIARKELWLSMGVKSWRPENLQGLSTPALKAGHVEGYKGEADVKPYLGTSSFDPVLCEIAYRWYCPPAGRILDPFAGASTAGIVGAILGYAFTGIDLDPRQVAEAKQQWAEVGPKLEPGTGVIAADISEPEWLEGDSANVLDLLPGQEESFDLLYSCPPYYSLERYSEKSNDLSAMGTYEDFLEAYFGIVRRCAKMLKNDRFAVWVVGDIRDPSGFYRDFVSDTVKAFAAAGMRRYNHATQVLSAASAAIRASRIFGTNRKLVRVHQDVIVFVKGDWKTAAAAMAPVEVPEDVQTESAE